MLAQETHKVVIELLLTGIHDNVVDELANGNTTGLHNEQITTNHDIIVKIKRLFGPISTNFHWTDG